MKHYISWGKTCTNDHNISLGVLQLRAQRGGSFPLHSLLLGMGIIKIQYYKTSACLTFNVPPIKN